MHELGVTFHIMDHLEKVAAENKVTHVRKVTLELGEVSTVIESYLQNCWTCFCSCSVIGIISSSNTTSVIPVSVVTCLSRSVHSKATNMRARINT